MRSSLDAMAKGLASGTRRCRASKPDSRRHQERQPRRCGADARDACRRLSGSRPGGRCGRASRDRPSRSTRRSLAAHLLLGLANTRLNRPQAAAAAYAAARKLEPAPERAAYLYAQRHSWRPEAGSGARPWPRSSRPSSGSHAATDDCRLQLDLLDDASVDAPLFVPAAYVEGFRLLARAKISRGAGEPARGRGRGSAGHGGGAHRRAPRSGRRTRAHRDSRQRCWHPAIARRRAPACSRPFAAFPTSGQAHWRLGRLGENGGDQAAALRAYEAAARARPWRAPRSCYAAIGRLQHTVLDLDAAARAYERRVALAPRSAPAHLDLGAGLSGAGSAGRRAGGVPGGGAGRSRQRARVCVGGPAARRSG